MKFQTLDADTWWRLIARARARGRPSDALVRHLRDRGVRGRPGGWMYRDAWLDAAGRPRGTWQPVCQGWDELLRQLCVILVGDDWQAIYGWRGAAEEGTSELEDELRWRRDGSPVMPRFVSLPATEDTGP